MNTVYVAAAATLGNPIQISSFGSLTLQILDGIVSVLLPFMVLAVVWTGSLLVFSAGKPEVMARNRNHLFWALIGVIIVLAAKGIFKIVENTVKDVQKGATTSVSTDETMVLYTLQDEYV